MSKKKFEPTPSQRDAIEAPKMDLLVSAAAGSGKTAVLSKRIVRMITDPAIRADLSRMLIVTFTKAAASELRARIGRELREALDELDEPSEERGDAEREITAGLLLDALDKLEGAEISTIHSFCMNLLKKYGDAQDTPTSFRIGEEAECKLMQLHAMNDTVESRYESDEEFNYIAENLVQLDDSELVPSLQKIYATMIEQPEGILFLKKSADVLRQAAVDFWKTDFALPIKRALNLFFDYYGKLYSYFFAVFADDGKWAKAYGDGFSYDHTFIKGWDRVKDSDYLTVRSYLLTYEKKGLGAYRGKTAEVEHSRVSRGAFQKTLEAYVERYFGFSEEDVSRDALDSAVYADKLYEVFSEFERRYESEKKRYGVLDFGDLERSAHRLLYRDGKPTPLARLIATRYDAIFIDEYQDTNQRQDEIFFAISDYNRFMVGDIKQSIYRFRGAMPEIFSHYRETFPRYERGAGQKQATIFLSNNFRSNKSVVDYSNAVFEKLFRNNSGRVPYHNEDALVYSVRQEQECHLPTRIIAVDKAAMIDENTNLSPYAVMAREIAALVREGVSPKDIAVLFRGMTNAELLRKELDTLSVKSVSAAGGDDFFLYPEALLLISLLNVIDNPCRDIYLAAVLKSPLFGLTLGDLVLLKSKTREKTLYVSVSKYMALPTEALSEEEGEVRKKLAVFLAFLQKARRYAERKNAAEILRYLYTVTPLRAIAVEASGNGACLDTLYELARGYEARGFKGLHAFVTYLAELEANPKTHPSVQSGVDLSAVQLLSIHKSKGLEFDYVFLAECDSGVLGKDAKNHVLCDKSIGVGMRLRERDGFVRYDTLIRQAVLARMDENALDEEMRILYVALTRAKKQLIAVTATRSIKDATAEARVAMLQRQGIIQHPYIYASSSSYAAWMLMATDYPVTVVDSAEAAAALCHDGEGRAEKAVSESLLLERLSFRYPYAALATLPTKLSVSRLYPGILDEEAEELLRSKKADFDRLPAFMQDKAAATGAERGTATHLFMQFCDFAAVKADGVEAEIRRLVEDKFITEAIAALIYRDKLERFFESALFARILAAEAVYREERFNVRLPAYELALDSEKREAYAHETVLVQGVIDCMIREKDGSLILIDYKTDRTPREREAAEAMLRERYTTQLSYYRRALEILYRTPVKETLLYSFSLDDTVTIE